MNACGVLFQMLVVLGVLFIVCSFKIILICKSYLWGVSLASSSHGGTVIYEMVGLNVRGLDKKRRIKGPRTDLKLQYALKYV